jgi:phosphoribosylanthranilate isomerase
MVVSRVIVQIYEIQDPVEAEALIELGVDRIGSVVSSEKHWKLPAVREAILVSRKAGVKHSLIPLFNTKRALFHTIDYHAPDIVHFCQRVADGPGDMVPCEALVELQVSVKERFPEIEVMRTIPVPIPGSTQGIPTFEVAKCLEATSDYFLVDTSLGREPVDGFVGITGRTCDWTVARELAGSSPLPVILAGGLSPENVYEAIMAVRPFGVDSCTRTNAIDGRGRTVRFQKDLNRVRAFVQQVRRAEKDLSMAGSEPRPTRGRK